MTDPTDQIVNTEWGRRPDGLKLSYQAVDSQGITHQAWGLEIDGSLPLDPRTLRSGFEHLPWRDSHTEPPGEIQVSRVEHRSVGQQIVSFIVEASPEAFYGAAVAAGLTWLGKRLKPWAKPRWTSGPERPTDNAEWLAYATLQAQSFAYDEFRDIPDDLTVVGQSLSHASTDEVAAVIVLRTSAGDSITIHMWFENGGLRHTSVRTRGNGTPGATPTGSEAAGFAEGCSLPRAEQ